MTSKAATLTDAQADFLSLVNVHFHLGVEHKSDAYKNGEAGPDPFVGRYP